MKHWFPVLMAGLLCAASAQANGLLIPTDGSIPPLALVRHEVKTSLVEQVAQTEVTQVFRNHTSSPLEATFVFPVPAGASVSRFSMWVDGKEVKGEMVEAEKARQIYTDIVRRMQDPGLLEYIGTNLLRVRVYPVPANGEQKLALRFTSVCNFDAGLVEYCYPLKTDLKAAQALEKFSIDATIESKHKVHNVYSPTHAVTVTPQGDNKTKVHFEAKKAMLDKDLKMYFSLGSKDVGLTALTYRPDANKDGSFLMLISPRAELAKSQRASRDIVFVLDQSGSMAGVKMEQAKKALNHCLSRLHPNDRFAVTAFATVVQRQHDTLRPASKQHVAEAKKWVEELEPTGGTAINDALADALTLDAPKAGGEIVRVGYVEEKARPRTIVFFTDGQPTVGEQDPEKIIKQVSAKNSASTRIFTFGVGDDVNAALLDRVSEMSRSCSTYVRPEEDIEVKTSNLFGKISHPVLTDLKVSASAAVTLSEMYPKQMPDLFHGGQLVVCGKFKGKGHAALTLKGKVDGESKELVYDIEFPSKTGEDRGFVENLWARRKVGYLLDEIRTNGQQKELIDEVTKLARKHGITTPYTSYLVVPDGVASNTPPQTITPLAYPASGPAVIRGAVPEAAPVTAPSLPADYYKNHGYNITPVFVSPSMQWAVPGAVPTPVVTAATATTPVPSSEKPAGTLRIFERGGKAKPGLGVPDKDSAPGQPFTTRLSDSGVGTVNRTDPVFIGLQKTPLTGPSTALPQAGKEGVELALVLDALRNEEQLKECKTVQAFGKTCREFGGAWIDDSFKRDMKIVRVKALSEAYFSLLAKQPQLKDVFRLGNRIVWVTPSGTALVIDGAGAEKMSDKEIDALFAKK